MSEVYNLSERLVMILVIYLCSLIISVCYLVKKVDRKKTSCIIFIMCIIYVSLFINLNVIAIMDLFFSHKQGFEKLTKYITTFYLVFTIVDKALGFVIFNIIIYYLESGYHSKIYKLLDILFRKIYSIKKIGLCKIIIILIIGVILISGLIAILIIYRDHFDLKQPYYYLFSLLDCYAIFEIYTGVGFFILQLIIDYRREKNIGLIKRYYRCSKVIIIKKTEKYVSQINHAYEVLNKYSPNFEKSNPSYYIYLKEILEDIKRKINYYQQEVNNISINNNINIFYYTNTNSNMNMNMNMNNINNYENNRINNIETNDKNSEFEIKKNQNNNKNDEDLTTCIRKYKKSVRRIEKFKKLYKEFDEKFIVQKNNNCNWRKIILFLALFMVIITDFLLPFLFDFSEEYEPEEKYEKEKSILELILAMLLFFLLGAICCAYTIITIYSTTRRRYITGDFLYGKNINDELSLMKTVQIVCGYSFALLYCNLYFWKALDKTGILGKPKYYEKVIVPDYTIKQGLSVYMIVKMVIIFVSIIASLCFSKFFVFKNDLAEYNLSTEDYEYNNDIKFQNFLNEKNKIVNILQN